MFPIEGGKVEINPQQIVSAHKDKDGDTWTLFMNDDKMYVVNKGEYAAIRELVNRQVRLVCQVEGDHK